MENSHKNTDPTKPWNNPMYKNDLTKPWNTPGLKDAPDASWNQLDGNGNDYKGY